MLRPLRLPDDFETVREVLSSTASFDVASNVQAFRQTMGNLRRFWPLLNLLIKISPAWADLFRGFIWEEAGKPQGVVVYRREGRSLTWHLAIIGVLSTARRNGIGRSLTETACEAIRAVGGKRVTLKIEGENQPAQQLARSAGFEQVYTDHILKLAPTRPKE